MCIFIHSDGVPLAHLMVPHIFTKRTRQTILDITSEELDNFVKTENYVAVLYHDQSKKCLKTLHDLELIKSDSYLFKILWRRIDISDTSTITKYFQTFSKISFSPKISKTAPQKSTKSTGQFL